MCVAAAQANIYCMVFKPSWAFLMVLTVSVQVYFHNLSVKWGQGHESDLVIFALSGE